MKKPSIFQTQAMAERVRVELAKREADVVAGCKSQQLQKAPRPKVMSIVKNMIHVKQNKFIWCPVHKVRKTKVECMYRYSFIYSSTISQ